MLRYSFSTVFMAFLTSSILVILISLAFLNRNVMANAGSKLLAALAGVAVLRLLLPCEFPFAVNIFPPQIISRVMSAFQSPRVQIRGIDISCWRICELIWVCGVIVRLTFGIRGYFHSKNYVLKYGTDMTDTVRYREPLDRICAQYGKANTFRVIELDGLNIPTFFHMGKPYILIPKDIAIPPDKLQYILRHEALHYFHHDHFTKLAVRLLSFMYWWNPVCIVLQKQINLLLEISVDRKVVCGDPVVREEYADCLLYMRRQALASASHTPGYLGRDSAFLLHAQSSDLKKRCAMLFHNTSPGKKAAIAFPLITLTAGTYLISLLYTVEAHYYPPEFKELTILTPDNTYIIQSDSGGYEIYTDDALLDTVTCLDFYPKGIKIYNEKGELIDEL